MATKKKKIIFQCTQAPGDIVMITAMIRDLHRAYPDQFLTDIRTWYDELFYNNPNLVRLNENDPDVQVVSLVNSFVNTMSSGPWHYIHSFIHEVNNKLSLSIKSTEFKGDLYLSKHEKTLSPINSNEEETITKLKSFVGDDHKYWIVCAGGKGDFIAKIWARSKWQKVVDHFKNKLKFVQIGKHSYGHCHPKLENTLNLVGQTPTLRHLMRVIYHSQGVCCGVSLPMHLSAAIPKADGTNRPCIVVAGGRESPQWEAYPGHQYIHTIGCLPCCDSQGCWAHQVTPLPKPFDRYNDQSCCFPIHKAGSTPQPACLDMIQPSDVIRRIEMYLDFKQKLKDTVKTSPKKQTVSTN